MEEIKLSGSLKTVIVDKNYYNQNYVREKEVWAENVSMGLQDQYRQWTAEKAVLLDAPTGLGKTTFILQTLIPLAQEYRKNVLVVSNRIALNTQQKHKVAEQLNSPILNMLNEKGVVKQEDFGCVHVVTYQRLYQYIEEQCNGKWFQDLMFVILDEAHFFTADSLFNASTSLILNAVTSKFHHAIRVYMTATSWDVLGPLANAEEANFKLQLRVRYENYYASYRPYSEMPKVRILHYRIQPTKVPSYRLHFIQSLMEIKPHVRKNDGRKWCVFVDNKENGQELKSKLDCECIYLDANSKSTSEWRELLETEMFPSQVLIATQALDCGINIKDKALKNIVISSTDHTSFIQMLGRKRCVENEKVDLWVVIPSAKTVANRLSSCRKNLELIELYNQCQTEADYKRFKNKLWFNYEHSTHCVFYPDDNGRFWVSETARYMLLQQEKFLSSIVGENMPSRFQEAVVAWVNDGKSEMCNGGITPIDSFYERYKNLSFSDEAFSELRTCITSQYALEGYVEPQLKRNKDLKHTALSNRLLALNYTYKITSQNGEYQIQKESAV